MITPLKSPLHPRLHVQVQTTSNGLSWKTAIFSPMHTPLGCTASSILPSYATWKIFLHCRGPTWRHQKTHKRNPSRSRFSFHFNTTVHTKLQLASITSVVPNITSLHNAFISTKRQFFDYWLFDHFNRPNILAISLKQHIVKTFSWIFCNGMCTCNSWLACRRKHE